MHRNLLKSEALDAASHWFVRQTSGHFSEADRSAWLSWREQDPANEYAWQQVEKVISRIAITGLSPAVGLATLDRPAPAGRRRALQQLAMLFALGGASWAGYRYTPWRDWRADYVTGVGEQRQVILQDGSQLTLNTNSSLNVIFTQDERRLFLRKGEIFVETASRTGDHRPFITASEHGEVATLATRLGLRKLRDSSRVDVFEGTVAVRSLRGSLIQRLIAGETTRFTEHRIDIPTRLTLTSPGWLNGVLVADNQPLSDFIAELARYRSGYLIADDSLSGLRISGAFPIADTDAILDSIADTLPVNIQRLTGYWVKVTAANG